MVDDSETIRNQVCGALAGAGFAVLEAADGVEGQARIAEHPDTAVVILDINMPRMGGLEMLESLKTNPKVALPAVLVLTTEAQQSLISRARAAGAKGWVIKPVNMDRLVDAVKKIA